MPGFLLKTLESDVMYPTYIIKELIRRKSKTATIVLTVAIVTAMLLLFSGVMNAYSSGVYQPFKNIGSDIILQKAANTTTQPSSGIRTPFGKGLFNEDEIEELSQISHVKNISKSLIVWNFGKNGFITIEGIEPDSFIGIKLSSEIKNGKFLSEKDKAIVLESHFANFNHFKTGDNIPIGDKSFKVMGILSIKDEGQIFASNIYTTIEDAQKISKTKGYNQIYLKIDELSNEELVKNEIKNLNNDIIIVSANSISSSISNVINIYNKFYYIGTGIIVLIVILILLKVNTVNLLERKKDIAVMRSVGWAKKDIIKQITTELFIQTIIGFFIGLIATFVILSLFGQINIQTSSLGLNKSTISIPITVPSVLILEYFIMILAVSTFVSFLLAKKISEIKPSENLRSL